jgi:hypothetical protein
MPELHAVIILHHLEKPIFEAFGTSGAPTEFPFTDSFQQSLIIAGSIAGLSATGVIAGRSILLGTIRYDLQTYTILQLLLFCKIERSAASQRGARVISDALI